MPSNGQPAAFESAAPEPDGTGIVLFFKLSDGDETVVPVLITPEEFKDEADLIAAMRLHLEEQ